MLFRSACPRIPSYLGWKLMNGNVSAQSTRYGPAQLADSPTQRPDPPPAGDQPPPSLATRSPRDGDEKPRIRPLGSSNKSRDGPEPPRPSPTTSLRPRQRRGAPRPASSNKSRDGEEELRRAGCYATPTTPCDGESLTATLLCSCPLLM